MSDKNNNYSKTKMACYYSYLSMASVFCVPPLLFVTFREMYGISYTLLGTLVLTNFCTQLTVDLIFSFFTKYFNIHKVVKVMPLLTSLGLLIYALVPSLFPAYAYPGLLLGTIIFSIAAGLSEVLVSPLIAALPSEHPEKDMSMLHSLYAWGVFTYVIISTVFLNLLGRENWMYLVGILALFPLGASYLYCTSPLPDMHLSHGADNAGSKHRNTGLILCVACIFLGSAAENTMSNWISGYMENALHIPKTYCDILGMALFALLLGMVRIWYGKRGGNIFKVLLISMIGAAACYLITSFSGNAWISAGACILIGCFTSMLWPGVLILMEEKIPNAGVAAYALMAAGGDFGASVAPQLLGIVVDNVSVSQWAVQLSASLALTPEQIGMKTGMLIASVFPLMGIAVLLLTGRYFRNKRSFQTRKELPS